MQLRLIAHGQHPAGDNICAHLDLAEEVIPAVRRGG